MRREVAVFVCAESGSRPERLRTLTHTATRGSRVSAYRGMPGDLTQQKGTSASSVGDLIVNNRGDFYVDRSRSCPWKFKWNFL